MRELWKAAAESEPPQANTSLLLPALLAKKENSCYRSNGGKEIMQSLLDQKLMDQLNAIPSLNEYFNRLPCKTKDWIIEAVKQAVKEWLENKKSHLPPALSSDHEIMACCIYNELIDNLSVQKDSCVQKDAK